MHDSRDEEPLTDASLDRAIEQALAVEPSPAFQARVRSRVASETFSRKQYGWWAIGVAACATPVLLLALYVALPGRAESPDAVAPEEVSGLAPVRPGRDRAELLPAALPPDTPLSVPAFERGPRQIARAAHGEGRQRQAGAAHHRIVMADVVIAEAEVRAVRALMERRLLEPERESEEATSGHADAADLTSVGTDLLADVTIAPLQIEPLELTARVQLQGE